MQCDQLLKDLPRDAYRKDDEEMRCNKEMQQTDTLITQCLHNHVIMLRDQYTYQASN
ncbi:hypothetical protein Scep_029907 [Stephania cephalantha]|uniref:Uncharacterized protein n=1 Tax=Stephania cephalantha TaxID=152367 RepID=A0AAP0DYT2_9MAGN